MYRLPADRFYATYFEGDETQGLKPDLETRDLWTRFLPADRVLPGNAKVPPRSYGERREPSAGMEEDPTAVRGV